MGESSDYSLSSSGGSSPAAPFSGGSDKSNSGLHFTSNSGNVTCNFASSEESVKVNFKKGDTWQSFYDNLLSSGCAKEEAVYVGMNGYGDSVTITQHRSEVVNNPAGTVADVYVFPNNRKHGAALSAIKTLSNNKYSNYAELAFNEEEKVVLLHSYLNNYYKITNKGCDLSGDALSLAQGDGYKAARIYDKESNSFKTCYVKAQEHANDKVYTWDSNNHININNQMTFDEVLNALNGFTIKSLSDPSAIDNITTSTEEPADVSSATACFANAGALGWIACPVLEAAGGLVETLYGFIETNFLQLDGSLITTDGLRSGWAQFRDFANILFAIAFVIVILAQVAALINIAQKKLKEESSTAAKDEKGDDMT